MEGDGRQADGRFADAAGCEAGGQGGVVAAGGRRIGCRARGVERDEQAAVWWLGAHGGAGESTLEELFSGSRAAGHSWPVTAAGASRRRESCWWRAPTRMG